jgi:uncharacterized membrane protein YfcA
MGHLLLYLLDPLVLLCGAAFVAGFVDAIAGGGGLIQLPACLILYPNLPVIAVIGTNKMGSLFGTTAAVGRFARSVKLDWNVIGPAAVVAFFLSMLGSRCAAALNPNVLRPVVFGLLILAAIYVYFVKDIGLSHRPTHTRVQGRWLGMLVGAVLGFYDGFFGPGTGSFLILIFTSLFGFEFLVASGSAKVINCATNLASVIFFVATGHVIYRLGLPMAACNIAGSMAGSHLAILKGSRFVRIFFLLIVIALIAKLGYDIFAR